MFISQLPYLSYISFAEDKIIKMPIAKIRKLICSFVFGNGVFEVGFFLLVNESSRTTSTLASLTIDSLWTLFEEKIKNRLNRSTVVLRVKDLRFFFEKNIAYSSYNQNSCNNHHPHLITFRKNFYSTID